jgi:hypothetical protein
MSADLPYTVFSIKQIRENGSLLLEDSQLIVKAIESLSARVASVKSLYSDPGNKSVRKDSFLLEYD